MDTTVIQKDAEDDKTLVEISPGVSFSDRVGLLDHQKLMIATDVADDDEISCPFMDSFGKSSFSGNLLCVS